MSQRDSSEHAGSAAVVILIGAVSLALASPGAVLIYVIERLSLARLDVEQRWTAAIVTSLAVWLAFRIRTSPGLAFARYVWCAVMVTAIAIVARFALHEEWPAQAWASFFG